MHITSYYAFVTVFSRPLYLAFLLPAAPSSPHVPNPFSPPPPPFSSSTYFSSLDTVDADGNVTAERLMRPAFVGYVGATFFVVNSLFSFLWGKAIPVIGRR